MIQSANPQPAHKQFLGASVSAFDYLEKLLVLGLVRVQEARDKDKALDELTGVSQKELAKIEAEWVQVKNVHDGWEDYRKDKNAYLKFSIVHHRAW